MKIRAFITHKKCEHYSECQDRFRINSDTKTIAVSDGMSESIFPEYWAGILSTHYANQKTCTEEERVGLCGQWLQKVEDYIETEEKKGGNPWRLKDRLHLKDGAGATLCGVSFNDTQNWSGHVLGDSCVVIIKDNKIVVDILSSEEKGFDCYPDYYDSFPEKEGRGTIKPISGAIDETSSILLVSDPFSDFFQKHPEGNEDILKDIFELNSHEGFCEFVEKWRNKGLHNDDSTLCIVEYDGKDAFDIDFADDINDLIENEASSIKKDEGDREDNGIGEEEGEEEKKRVVSFEEYVEEKVDTGIESSPTETLDEKRVQEPIVNQLEEHNDNNTSAIDDYHNQVMDLLDNLIEAKSSYEPSSSDLSTIKFLEVLDEKILRLARLVRISKLEEVKAVLEACYKSLTNR